MPRHEPITTERKPTYAIGLVSPRAESHPTTFPPQFKITPSIFFYIILNLQSTTS